MVQEEVPVVSTRHEVSEAIALYVPFTRGFKPLPSGSQGNIVIGGLISLLPTVVGRGSESIS
jgi:hypothetical protein